MKTKFCNIKCKAIYHYNAIKREKWYILETDLVLNLFCLYELKVKIRAKYAPPPVLELSFVKCPLQNKDVLVPQDYNNGTCPVLSASLLVSLTFSKDTDNLWSPRIENGLSGCKYCLFGGGGSALPATNQEDRW